MEKDVKSILPAVHANNFSVTVGEVVTIAFMEQRDKDSPFIPRASVVMTRQNAHALAKLISQLLQEN